MNPPGSAPKRDRFKVEEVDHDFREMRVKLSCTISNVLFQLTQWVELGCGGVHYSLYGEHHLIKLKNRDQPLLGTRLGLHKI